MVTSKCLLVIGLLATVWQCSLGQTVSTPLDVDVNEEAGSLVITLTINPIQASLWGAVADTIDGTAVAGSDFTGLTAVNIIGTGGSATVDVTVDILDDTDFDPGESFIVAFTGVTGASGDFNVTVNIIDNERIPVNLTAMSNRTVSESIGNFTFSLSRDDLTTHDFNVSVSTEDGTAIAGEDFNALMDYEVFFDTNQGSAMLAIYIIDDEIEEESEMFMVTIHGPQISQNYSFYITIEDNDIPDNFHCRRGVSQPCLNGGTCGVDDGTCMCAAGFEGENCGIETANITTGCGCVNGTCVNNGAGDVCMCDGGFAGELCDMRAYYHSCEANGFSVCITPFSADTFNGRIYVQGQFTNPACQITMAPMTPDPNDDLADWCMGYAAFIGYNDTCGELGPIENGDVSQFRLHLVVQYSPNTFRMTDEAVTFTCQYSNTTLVAFAGVNGVDSSASSVQRSTADLVPAQLTISDSTGNDLPSPLAIGELARFCLSVATVDAFSSIIIDVITANNTRSGSDFRSLVLYDNGCVPADAAGIIVQGPYWDPMTASHTMCFRVEAFVFAHDINLPNPALGVAMEFRINETENAFTAHTCTSRRKREVREFGEQEEMVGATIYLINPDAMGSSAALDEKLCGCSSWLVPALIGLGVVSITMALIIIALTIAVFRHVRERRREKHH